MAGHPNVADKGQNMECRTEHEVHSAFAAHARGEVVRLEAGCKINLGLRITGQREDGYHYLDSIFYPLSAPADSMQVAQSCREGLTVLTDCRGIDPKHNTLTKAWQLFCEATGCTMNLVLSLKKGIPWGAGLGGGSADAAVFLRHLRERAASFGCTMTDEALDALAARVGADVPFFLYNRPMRVRGTGEILEPVSLDLSGFCLVLVMPCFTVSTPWAYKAYDEAMACRNSARGVQKSTHMSFGKGCGTGAGSRAGGCAGGFAGQLPENGQSCLQALTAMAKMRKESLPIDSPVELANDLEPVVFKRYPALGGIKSALLARGACAASMSGSGSSIYALFADRAEAEAAASDMEWPVQLSSLAGM